jgi:hypothetical protein
MAPAERGPTEVGIFRVGRPLPMEVAATFIKSGLPALGGRLRVASEEEES